MKIKNATEMIPNRINIMILLTFMHDMGAHFRFSTHPFHLLLWLYLHCDNNNNNNNLFHIYHPIFIYFPLFTFSNAFCISERESKLHLSDHKTRHSILSAGFGIKMTHQINAIYRFYYAQITSQLLYFASRNLFFAHSSFYPLSVLRTPTAY